MFPLQSFHGGQAGSFLCPISQESTQIAPLHRSTPHTQNIWILSEGCWPFSLSFHLSLFFPPVSLQMFPSNNLKSITIRFSFFNQAYNLLLDDPMQLLKKLLLQLYSFSYNFILSGRDHSPLWLHMACIIHFSLWQEIFTSQITSTH